MAMDKLHSVHALVMELTQSYMQDDTELVALLIIPQNTINQGLDIRHFILPALCKTLNMQG